jgi:hypothetical protein
MSVALGLPRHVTLLRNYIDSWPVTEFWLIRSLGPCQSRQAEGLTGNPEQLS